MSCPQDSGALDPRSQPVFVLCSGRSGSTLLRFLLDSHPDLACPPETNLPVMAGQLATVWSLIAGAPLSNERGDQPPVIPEEAIRGVRRTLDEMIGSYLIRRGKKRYCDKSLGAARFAELLLRVYPGAKFLCLYRHPMDVIASGIEACPWGLNGYGFDAYTAGTPGNAVWALARFWVDNAAAILETEEQFDASCHRIRYEDLVAEPERVADGIFSFLGLEQAPGISVRCFAADRERSGPADYKIWHTTRISATSVGRGWSVPAAMIPPPVRDQLNELASKLGYVPVDATWGTASVPSDLRTADGRDPARAADVAVKTGGEAVPVAKHLTAGLSRMDGQFGARWGPCTAECFTIAALSSSGGSLASSCLWRVDVAARTVTTAVPSDDDDTAWDLVGSADAWQAVLDGRMNLGVALRRCDLRYCDSNEAGPVAADMRIGMLSELIWLGSSWQPAAQTGEERAELDPASWP